MNQFNALFKIPGRLRLWCAKTQPQGGDRKQSQRNSRDKALADFAARYTVHPPGPHRFAYYVQKMRVFAGEISPMVQHGHNRPVYLSWPILAMIEHHSSNRI